MELLKVLFSSNKTEEQIPYPGQVVITPTSEGWNDFTYRINCSYKVCLHDGERRYEGKLLLGFISPKEFMNQLKEQSGRMESLGKGRMMEIYDVVSHSLSQFLEKIEGNFISSEELPFFFTMLPTMQDYRYLVERFDEESLNLILDSLNDLVYSKRNEEKWLRHALDSEVFQLGFMRNSEPFFTYHNGETILDGVELTDGAGISEDLLLQFQLQKYESPHAIGLSFDSKSIIPKRIAVLIGKNGLGKSETLKAFCRGALQYKDRGLSLTDSQGERPQISRIIAIATPGETNNTFPREIQKTQKLYYRKFTLTRKGMKSISNSLVRLARGNERGEESIGHKSRWELFEASIRKTLPYNDIYLKLKNDEYLPLNSLQHPGSEQRRLLVWGGLEEGADPAIKAGDKFFPMSSGQLTFFKFAILCCLHIENGSFVLMDEPETHMHPNMISDFVSLLDELLEQTGSFAILSSHSAYFVREVPRDQVHIFKEADQQVLISNPRLRTFGADVDSISDFVFEENIESSLTDKIFERVRAMKFETVESELGDELSYAALMDLRARLES